MSPAAPAPAARSSAAAAAAGESPQGKGVRPGYWSGRPPVEPFHLFGPAHLTALAAVGAGVLALRCVRDRPAPTRRAVTKALVAALWGQELGFHAWRAATGRWTPQEMLPIHACSVALWVGGAGALTGSRLLRDYGYYLGVAGAAQALITPDLAGYGPRNVQFAQFFVSHGLLVALGVQLVVNERHRPTWRGAARTWGVLAAQALVAHAVNRRIGSNYMFVTRKPDTASVIDWLPPWPGYIPVLFGVAGVAIGALTLPFSQLRNSRREPSSAD